MMTLDNINHKLPFSNELSCFTQIYLMALDDQNLIMTIHQFVGPTKEKGQLYFPQWVPNRAHSHSFALDRMRMYMVWCGDHGCHGSWIFVGSMAVLNENLLRSCWDLVDPVHEPNPVKSSRPSRPSDATTDPCKHFFSGKIPFTHLLQGHPGWWQLHFSKGTMAGMAGMAGSNAGRPNWPDKLQANLQRNTRYD